MAKSTRKYVRRRVTSRSTTAWSPQKGVSGQKRASQALATACDRLRPLATVGTPRGRRWLRRTCTDQPRVPAPLYRCLHQGLQCTAVCLRHCATSCTCRRHPKRNREYLHERTVLFRNVPVPQPATMENQTLWANTATWWIFVSGEKSIDAASCQESGNTPTPLPRKRFSAICR